MPKKITKKREYPIYINPRAIEAYFDFLKIINEKIKIDEYWKKDEILEELKKKGHNISKSSIHDFTKMVIESQKAKQLFDLKNVITVR